MLKNFLITLFLFSLSAFAQSNVDKLQRQINEVISDSFFTHTQIAIDVYDLKGNKQLYEHNSKLLLNPASNMKLLTTAAALTYLGRDYIFQTSLYHTGVIEGDTLYGDLYVAGGFDPDFTTDDLDSLVKAVKSIGIKTITGNLYADISLKDSLYWGKGWMWDDNPGPSAPYLSSLNINDNSIEVFVEGTKVGYPAKVILIPETKYVDVVNHSTTVSSYSESDVEITRDWVNDKNKIIVEGKVKSGIITDSSDQKEKLNLIEPYNYFLTLFREHLVKNNVFIEGKNKVKQLPENSVYLSSFNRKLDSVVVHLNKESDNLSAEMLIYSLALNDSGVPAIAENGIQALKKLIDSLNLNPEDYYLADGSGASRYNLISTELLINLLRYMYKSPDYVLYFTSLPVAGIDGTLEKRMIDTPAEGNVHAKTGTLEGVSALSGYVRTKNNNLLAFSILVQNYVGKSSLARSYIDRICEMLTEY
ncbi:MAG: D-alanyl-D-alanine carboxypeptidase/D-alanyl-D-alanine-endopeptidase [Ignavibacteriaceae bacterium]